MFVTNVKNSHIVTRPITVLHKRWGRVSVRSRALTLCTFVGCHLLLHKAGSPPYDGTHALTTWLLLKNLDKASLELAMNCWT